MDRRNKPSPAWRERVPNGVRRVRVSAPAPVASGASGAFTLTRFASLTTLSRQAGEGFPGPADNELSACDQTEDRDG